MKLISTLKLLMIFITVTFLCSCSNIDINTTQNTDINPMPILDNPSVLNAVAPVLLKADGFRDLKGTSMTNRYIYLKVPMNAKSD